MKILNNNKIKALIAAFLSAFLFGICTPYSKILSKVIPSVELGGLLYLGAGIGLFVTVVLKKGKKELFLTKKELPYLILMVLLDILAIICLMVGLFRTNSANASLLGNFELVATTIFARLLFQESISKKLIISIGLITLGSIILTFEGAGSFCFNSYSIFVLLSCVFWGLENNCTKKLSIKDTRQITIIKGIFSGFGCLLIAFLLKKIVLYPKFILLGLLLGLFSYGISVSLYIFSQRYLGASKTGACFSLAPFFGVIFSFLILSESLGLSFYLGLVIMIIAVFLVIKDTINP